MVRRRRFRSDAHNRARAELDCAHGAVRLEEGKSRKFYRVDLVGKRVELTWGRIGGAPKRKVIECESEADAKREWETQTWKRREHGYTLVIDEGRPRDPDAARAKANADKLATGAPLTNHPRFRFVSSTKRSFVWIEVRGATLVRAEGRIGDEDHVTPVENMFASEKAATRERDAVTAKLLATGHTLDAFGKR